MTLIHSRTLFSHSHTSIFSFGCIQFASCISKCVFHFMLEMFFDFESHETVWHFHILSCLLRIRRHRRRHRVAFVERKQIPRFRTLCSYTWNRYIEQRAPLVYTCNTATRAQRWMKMYYYGIEMRLMHSIYAGLLNAPSTTDTGTKKQKNKIKTRKKRNYSTRSNWISVSNEYIMNWFVWRAATLRIALFSFSLDMNPIEAKATNPTKQKPFRCSCQVPQTQRISYSAQNPLSIENPI